MVMEKEKGEAYPPVPLEVFCGEDWDIIPQLEFHRPPKGRKIFKEKETHKTTPPKPPQEKKSKDAKESEGNEKENDDEKDAGDAKWDEEPETEDEEESKAKSQPATSAS